MKERVVIVSDAAINLVNKDPDDVFAILFGLLSEASIKIEGIVTTFGNVPLPQANRTLGILLNKAGRFDIPVYEGSESPLKRSLLSQPGKEIRTDIPETKLKIIHPNGIDYLVDTVVKNPGKITVISIGPMTDIAKAILKDENFSKSVKQVLIMGGAIAWPSMDLNMAEWNIKCDPDAAKIVFSSALKKVIFPLDVTMKVRLEKNVLELLAQRSEIMKWLEDVTETWYAESSYNEFNTINGIPLHDLLPFVYIIDPSLFTFCKTGLEVDTDPTSENYGKMKMIDGNDCSVAFEVNVNGVIKCAIGKYVLAN